MSGVPGANTLELIDSDSREINLVALVLGDRAPSYLAALHTQTRDDEAQSGRSEPPIADHPTHLYMVLHLGRIHDYETRIHFYGFRSLREAALATVRAAIARANTLLLAPRDRREASALFPSLHEERQQLGSAAPPAVVLTGEHVSRVWTETTGADPVATFSPTDRVLDPIRTIVEIALARLGLPSPGRLA